MGLPRTQRIARSDQMAPGGLELSPEDYFVLSRIEGTPTIAEAIAATGLPRDHAEQILVRLLGQGALSTPPPDAVGSSTCRPPSRPSAAGHPTAVQASPQGDTDLRRRARERRRTVLGAMLSSRTSEPEPAAAPRAETRPTPPAEAPRAKREAVPTPEPLPFVDVEPVAEHDPRLDPNAAIPFDDQRWLLALADRVDELDEFAFLGIAPTQDLKVIRRAYHERSRKLHPDTYYGREIGFFRELLTALFSHARQAHRALQDPEVRDKAVARQAALQRLRSLEEGQATQHEDALSQQDEASRLAEEERRRLRGRARAQERVQRQRSAVRASLLAEAKKHSDEAEVAYREGNLAKAANFYRLALRADPDDPVLRSKWESVRDEARRARAAAAFARGVSLLESGLFQEAAVLLSDAAEVDPILAHLAHAADAVRHTDPERARDLAMAALDALQRELSQHRTVGGAASTPAAKPLPPAKVAAFHLMIGRAFLAAGQNESARRQAIAASLLCPDDPDVRTLVNSIKVA